jgi:RNA polymerase sigma factor for flagellar operon FliA
LELLPDPNAVDPRNVLQIKMLRDLVEVQIRALKERERIVVSLYYLEDLNLKEIGKILSVTESRVSQVLKEATERLKRRVRLHFSDDDIEANQLE